MATPPSPVYMAQPVPAQAPTPSPAPMFTQMDSPVVVVGPQFLVPYPTDLLVTEKLTRLREDFYVTDVNENLMFTVKGSIFSIHDNRVVLDAAGFPILSLRQKVLSAHRRWCVYRGESTKSHDMLFTVKKTSILQMKTKLDVFLTTNTSKDSPDFHIEEKVVGTGCTVYFGTTPIILAQMRTRLNIASLVLDKDTYGVKVSPNVDYAFIIALVVVLHEINLDRNGED